MLSGQEESQNWDAPLRENPKIGVVKIKILNLMQKFQLLGLLVMNTVVMVILVMKEN